MVNAAALWYASASSWAELELAQCVFRLWTVRGPAPVAEFRKVCPPDFRCSVVDYLPANLTASLSEPFDLRKRLALGAQGPAAADAPGHVCQFVQHSCTQSAAVQPLGCIPYTPRRYRLGPTQPHNRVQGDIVFGEFATGPATALYDPLADRLEGALDDWLMPQSLLNSPVHHQVKICNDSQAHFERRSRAGADTLTGLLHFHPPYTALELYAQTGNRHLLLLAESPTKLQLNLAQVHPVLRLLNRTHDLPLNDPGDGCWISLPSLTLEGQRNVRPPRFIDLDPREDNVQGYIVIEATDGLLPERVSINNLTLACSSVERKPYWLEGLFDTETAQLCEYVHFEGDQVQLMVKTNNSTVAHSIEIEDFIVDESELAAIQRTSMAIDSDPRPRIARLHMPDAGGREYVYFKDLPTDGRLIDHLLSATISPLQFELDGAISSIIGIPVAEGEGVLGRLMPHEWKRFVVDDAIADVSSASSGPLMLGPAWHHPSIDNTNSMLTAHECATLCADGCLAWQMLTASHCEWLRRIDYEIPGTQVLRSGDNLANSHNALYALPNRKPVPPSFRLIELAASTLPFSQGTDYTVTWQVIASDNFGDTITVAVSLMCGGRSVFHLKPTVVLDLMPVPGFGHSRFNIHFRSRVQPTPNCELVLLADSDLTRYPLIPVARDESRWYREPVTRAKTLAEAPAPLPKAYALPHMDVIALSSAGSDGIYRSRRVKTTGRGYLDSEDCDVIPVNGEDLYEVRSSTLSQCNIKVTFEVSKASYTMTEKVTLCQSDFECDVPNQPFDGFVYFVDSDPVVNRVRGDAHVVFGSALVEDIEGECYVLLGANATEYSSDWSIIGHRYFQPEIATLVNLSPRTAENTVLTIPTFTTSDLYASVTSSQPVLRIACYLKGYDAIVFDTKHFDWDRDRHPAPSDDALALIGDLNNDASFLGFYLEVTDKYDGDLATAKYPVNVSTVCVSNPSQAGAPCLIDLSSTMDCHIVRKHTFSIHCPALSVGALNRVMRTFQGETPVVQIVVEYVNGHHKVFNLEVDRIFTRLPLDYAVSATAHVLEDASKWDHSPAIGTIQTCREWDSQSLLTGRGCTHINQITSNNRMDDYYWLRDKQCEAVTGEIQGLNDELVRAFTKQESDCQRLCMEDPLCTHYTFTAGFCQASAQFLKPVECTNLCTLRSALAPERRSPLNLLGLMDYEPLAQVDAKQVTLLCAKGDVLNKHQRRPSSIMLGFVDLDQRPMHYFGYLTILELFPVSVIKTYTVVAVDMDNKARILGHVDKTSEDMKVRDTDRLEPITFSVLVELSDFDLDKILVFGSGAEAVLYGIEVVDTIDFWFRADPVMNEMRAKQQTEFKRVGTNLSRKPLRDMVKIQVQDSVLTLSQRRRLSTADVSYLIDEARAHGHEQEGLEGHSYSLQVVSGSFAHSRNVGRFEWLVKFPLKGTWFLLANDGTNRWPVRKLNVHTLDKPIEVSFLTTYLDLAYGTIEACFNSVRHMCLPLPHNVRQASWTFNASDMLGSIAQALEDQRECSYSVQSDDLDLLRNATLFRVRVHSKYLANQRLKMDDWVSQHADHMFLLSKEEIEELLEDAHECVSDERRELEDEWLALRALKSPKFVNEDQKPQYMAGRLEINGVEVTGSVQRLLDARLFAAVHWHDGSMASAPITLAVRNVNHAGPHKATLSLQGRIPFGTRKMGSFMTVKVHGLGMHLLEAKVEIQGSNPSLAEWPTQPQQLPSRAAPSQDFIIAPAAGPDFAIEVHCSVAPIWVQAEANDHSKWVVCRSVEDSPKVVELLDDDCYFVSSAATTYRVCGAAHPKDALDDYKKFRVQHVSLHPPRIVVGYPAEHEYIVTMPNGMRLLSSDQFSCPLNTYAPGCSLLLPDGYAYEVLPYTSDFSITPKYGDGRAIRSTDLLPPGALTTASTPKCRAWDLDPRPGYVKLRVYCQPADPMVEARLHLLTASESRSLNLEPLSSSEALLPLLHVDQFGYVSARRRLTEADEEELIEIIDDATAADASVDVVRVDDALIVYSIDCGLDITGLIVNDFWHPAKDERRDIDGICYTTVPFANVEDASEMLVVGRTPQLGTRGLRRYVGLTSVPYWSATKLDDAVGVCDRDFEVWALNTTHGFVPLKEDFEWVVPVNGNDLPVPSPRSARVDQLNGGLVVPLGTNYILVTSSTAVRCDFPSLIRPPASSGLLGQLDPPPSQNVLLNFYMLRHSNLGHCETLRRMLLNLLTLEYGAGYIQVVLNLGSESFEATLANLLNSLEVLRSMDHLRTVLTESIEASECRWHSGSSLAALMWLHNRREYLSDIRVSEPDKADAIDEGIYRRATYIAELTEAPLDQWLTMFNSPLRNDPRLKEVNNASRKQLHSILPMVCQEHLSRMQYLAPDVVSFGLDNDATLDCTPSLLVPILHHAARPSPSRQLFADEGWDVGNTFDPSRRGYILKYQMPGELWAALDLPAKTMSISTVLANMRANDVALEQELAASEHRITTLNMTMSQAFPAILSIHGSRIYVPAAADEADCNGLIHSPPFLPKLDSISLPLGCIYANALGHDLVGTSLITRSGALHEIKPLLPSRTIEHVWPPCLSSIQSLVIDFKQADSSTICMHEPNGPTSCCHSQPKASGGAIVYAPIPSLPNATRITVDGELNVDYFGAPAKLIARVQDDQVKVVDETEEPVALVVRGRYGQEVSLRPIRVIESKSVGAFVAEYELPKHALDGDEIHSVQVNGGWHEFPGAPSAPTQDTGRGICYFQSCIDVEGALHCPLCERHMSAALKAMTTKNTVSSDRLYRWLCSQTGWLDESLNSVVNRFSPDALSHTYACGIHSESLAHRLLKAHIRVDDEGVFESMKDAQRYVRRLAANTTVQELLEHLPVPQTPSDGLLLWDVLQQLQPDATLDTDNWLYKDFALVLKAPEPLLEDLDFQTVRPDAVKPEFLFGAVSAAPLESLTIPSYIRRLHETHLGPLEVPLERLVVKASGNAKSGSFSLDADAAPVGMAYYDIYKALSLVSPAKYPPRELQTSLKTSWTSVIPLIILILYLDRTRSLHGVKRSYFATALIHPVKWTFATQINEHVLQTFAKRKLSLMERIGRCLISRERATKVLKQLEETCWVFDDPDEEFYYEELCLEALQPPLSPHQLLNKVCQAVKDKNSPLHIASSLTARYRVDTGRLADIQSRLRVIKGDDRDALALQLYRETVRSRTAISKAVSRLYLCQARMEGQPDSTTCGSNSVAGDVRMLPIGYMRVGVCCDNNHDEIVSSLAWIGPDQHELYILPESTFLSLNDDRMIYWLNGRSDFICIPLINTETQLSTSITSDAVLHLTVFDEDYNTRQIKLFSDDTNELILLDSLIQRTLELTVMSIADSIDQNAIKAFASQTYERLYGTSFPAEAEALNVEVVPELDDIVNPMNSLHRLTVAVSAVDSSIVFGPIPFTTVPCLVDEAHMTNIYLKDNFIFLQVNLTTEQGEPVTTEITPTNLNRTQPFAFQSLLDGDRPLDNDRKEALSSSDQLTVQHTQTVVHVPTEHGATEDFSFVQGTAFLERESSSIQPSSLGNCPLWDFHPLPDEKEIHSGGWEPLAGFNWLAISVTKIAEIDLVPTAKSVDTSGIASLYNHAVNVQLTSGEHLCLGFSSATMARQVYLTISECLDELRYVTKPVAQEVVPNADLKINRHEMVTRLGLDRMLVEKLSRVLAVPHQLPLLWKHLLFSDVMPGWLPSYWLQAVFCFCVTQLNQWIATWILEMEYGVSLVSVLGCVCLHQWLIVGRGWFSGTVRELHSVDGNVLGLVENPLLPYDGERMLRLMLESATCVYGLGRAMSALRAAALMAAIGGFAYVAFVDHSWIACMTYSPALFVMSSLACLLLPPAAKFVQIKLTTQHWDWLTPGALQAMIACFGPLCLEVPPIPAGERSAAAAYAQPSTRPPSKLGTSRSDPALHSPSDYLSHQLSQTF